MELREPYLSSQIIAYIGNKRGLLPLIHEAILNVLPNGVRPGIRFFDPFAGSGVVSRLAKKLNFEVIANDWEEYSFIINTAYLSINKSDIPSIFESERRLKDLLYHFNNLPDSHEEEQYIAKYYAPSTVDIDKVDFRKERLFYTRQNALAIDKIRNEIDRIFPPKKKTYVNQRRRQLSIALLLYEAATHTNTSGVFKAYHKGFGGHNKDALTRILAPIKLRYPCLCESNYPCVVYKDDATDLAQYGLLDEFDIAYLDPPYNQHQYGSNYHLLNTIAVWDKIPAPLELNEKGVLRDKAAIRKDWIETRSDYCYKVKAEAAFKDLIESIRAHYIIVSYSTDGIIPFEDVKDICADKGDVNILTNEYVKYRGGKQSNGRSNLNIEYVLIIDSEKKALKQSLAVVDKTILVKKVLILFKKRYSELKLSNHFDLVESDNRIERVIQDKRMKLATPDFFELNPPDYIDELSIRALKELYNCLSLSACETKEEELQEIMDKLDGSREKVDEYLKLIPNTLRKLAHKKYKDAFFTWLERVKNLEEGYPESYALIDSKVRAVEEQAYKRFSN